MTAATTPGEARATRSLGPLWFAVPVVVAAFISFGRDWTPVGDLALVDLQLRHFWSDLPLIGPYSRLGWHHPGPALYWLYWLPWRLVGGGARGLLFATLLWHAAASALSLWLARRCGGRRLMALGSLALLCTAVASQTDALLQPWNPFLNLTLVPALAFSFIQAARGDRVGALWFVTVASVMAQNHLGLLPPTLALGGLVALAFVARFVRATDRREVLTTAVMSVAVGTAIWSPPVVEQLRGDPGNLGLLLKWAREPKDHLGVSGAAHILGRMLGPTPPWLGIRPPLADLIGGTDTSRGGWQTLPILALVPLVALAVSYRRGDRRAIGVLVGLGAVVATGFAATVSLSGLPYEYLVAWVSVSCASWVLAGIWASTRAVALPRFAAEHPGRWCAAWLALVGTLLGGYTVFAPDPYLFLEPAARSLRTQLLDRLGPRPGSVDFEKITDLDAMSVLSSQVMALERAGWTTYVPRQFADVGFAGSRVSERRDPGRVRLTIASGLVAREMRDDPELDLVAEYQPFDARREARILEILRQLRESEQRPAVTDADRLNVFAQRMELSWLRGDRVEISIFRRR